MNKSILEIIKELQASGRSVKYRKRSDGGYIITEINGIKYKAAEGNKVAREISNAPLSEFRSRQLKRITPKTKRAAKQRVVPKALKIKNDVVDDELKSLLRKAQKLWRKTARYTKGSSPTIRNLRWTIRNEGREVAIQKLENIIRYAKGYANYENIRWLKIRLTNALGEKLADPINSTIDKMAETFKDDWINVINQIAYDKSKSKKQRAREIMQFLKTR